jgi:anti-sigma B factor antagonist
MRPTRLSQPVIRRCDVAELRLSSERRGGSLVIAVDGELDIVTSRQLDEQLMRARRNDRRVVLDLSAVEFMAVIVGHWKRLESVGGTLALAGARYRYTKTLWITGLADRLPMYETVDEAVAAAGPGDSPAADGQAADAATGAEGRSGRG